MSIWHKPDEKPIQHRWIVVKYRAPVKPSCKFVEKDTYISPVCDYAYVNDLVQDYNRTRKALNVAVDALKEIEHYTLEQELQGICTKSLIAEQALEQITALEQGGDNGSNS